MVRTITPLHLAALNPCSKRGDLSVIDVFLAFGADPTITCYVRDIILFLNPEAHVSMKDQYRLADPYVIALEFDIKNEVLRKKLLGAAARKHAQTHEMFRKNSDSDVDEDCHS